MSRHRTAAHAGMVLTASILVGAVLAALEDTARGVEAGMPDGAPPAARAAEPARPAADGRPSSGESPRRGAGAGGPRRSSVPVLWP